MNKQNQYLTMLNDLKSGLITPRSVVGGGYKNGRKVALEWLYTQILNEQLLLNEKVSNVYASASGKPFNSAEKARASKVYQTLFDDEFITINDLPVVDYGIKAGVDGQGFLVWIKIGRRRPLSKVA